MRRAHIIIASTVIGLAAVVGYRPNMTHNVTSLASASASTPIGANRGRRRAARAASAASAPATSAAPTNTASPAGTAAPAATAAVIKTVLGSNEMITEYGRQFGEIQAKLTIKNGKITNVGLGNVRMYDGHSAEIANYSVPRLMQQTIDAQSASINGISGATYTSQAYEASVQAALDKVRV